MTKQVGVVVVAGGKGSRMGTSESKQYLPVAGIPILVRTLMRFEEWDEADAIVLVTGEADVPRCRAYVETYGLTKVTAVVSGGAERQASVHEGIKALPDEVEWVLVHDAVRPFVTLRELSGCLRTARETGAAVLAVPVKDTIKIVGAEGRVEATPDRRSLWAVQTPQAFRRAELEAAHRAAEEEGFLGTDDAMLMERAGVPVHVAEGSYTNIKITTPEDLAWAQWHVEREKGEGEA
ncbi:2-C-methyl-D-erythritol 4-phosphate cytidylyltransferase [Paenibacillus sp. J31TS4]|uniref:2-C-methyl-D-erythritol 4-phosphate cytidylyltransferase n=1 Tax=Paenibacillus sp. J31TS4 TaxID=2807195 RepID=UPI001BCD7321|nr:2-C-methyl-D-erythritol 4-phosphate cytidylyltransferase [Paenibacillus sp. J31TS4]